MEIGEEDNDFILKFNYKNSFWENTDILYQHTKNRMEEYSNISNLFEALSSSINNFSESLFLNTKLIKPIETQYISTRFNTIEKFVNFINKIIENLKIFSRQLKEFSKSMNEKIEAYKNKVDFEKLCQTNYNKFNECMKKLDLRKDIYNESVDYLIETFLNNKYRDFKTPIDLKPKIENSIKKKKEYKEEVKNCDDARIEYIKIQRNIIDGEQEYDIECSEELKKIFKKLIGFYNELLNKSLMDDDLFNAIDKIDGNKDINDFSERNRDIISSPPRINFSEYIQDMDQYYNYEVIKNKLKSLKKNEQKEFKKEISIEIKKFLEENIYVLDENKELNDKFSQIADDILNKTLKEEDYQFVINEFQNKYNDFIEWKKNVIGDRNNLQVGREWDNRFNSINIFLGIFNKLRLYNKEMKKENYDYLVKIFQKIIEFNNGDEVDYSLCELLIVLSSTFYMVELKDGKEKKIYISEGVKHCELFQKCEFWFNLVKNLLNDEIIKKRIKENQIERKKSFLNNINKNLTSLNFNININLTFNFKKIPLLLGKKNRIDNDEKYNKIIMARLISISYNLAQYVLNSDTLNKAVYNIFRFYKLSLENKKSIIEMINIQIMSEGNTNLKIDEDLLLNNKFDKYRNEKKENKNIENIIDINNIQNEEKNDIIKTDEINTNEIKEDKNEELGKKENEIKK